MDASANAGPASGSSAAAVMMMRVIAGPLPLSESLRRITSASRSILCVLASVVNLVAAGEIDDAKSRFSTPAIRAPD